jgi:hypothetical protein
VDGRVPAITFCCPALPPLLLTTDDGPFRVRTAEKIGAACASSTGSDAGSLCHAWW